jgi:DNA recombination protein RmuC
MEILYVLIGFAAGAVISLLVYIFLSKKIHKKQQELADQEKEFISRSSDREKEIGVLSDRLSHCDKEIAELNIQYESQRSRADKLQNDNTRIQTEYTNLLKKLDEQKIELENLQLKLKTEFENIASQILKRNSEDLSNYNRERLDEILKPFREKLVQMETNVTQTYEKSLKDTTALQTEVKQLYELSRKLGEEANNLTRALKGDVKKQGNWGEVILERILERSGLRKGFEYEIQTTTTDSDGKMIRPDVIIHLPDKKHLIIDSKVSLVAYEQLVNCDSDADRQKFLKAHLDSVKSHIKLLSGKHYQQSEGLNSPDFVLLFIPIEASFSTAIQEDKDLFSFAWDNKTVIVSPSTLLATLLTIASMWKQENQTRNAMEIARQSGALYDKFVGFLEDLEKLERNLDNARIAYSDAVNKLKTGKGNLITRAENIKSLGAKATKNIPEKFILEESGDQTEETIE